jgi:hypothetical protein
MLVAPATLPMRFRATPAADAGHPPPSPSSPSIAAVGDDGSGGGVDDDDGGGGGGASSSAVDLANASRSIAAASMPANDDGGGGGGGGESRGCCRRRCCCRMSASRAPMRLSSDADVRGWTSSTIATVDDDDRDADGPRHPPRPPRRPRAPPLVVAEGDGTKASEVGAAEGEPPAVRMVIPAAVAARLRLQGFVIVAAGLEGIPRHAVSVGMELCVWLPIIYYCTGELLLPPTHMY